MKEVISHLQEAHQIQITTTPTYEMILTEQEKEEAIQKHIKAEKHKKDCVFGKKVRDTDISLIVFDRDEIINLANAKKHYEIEKSQMALAEYDSQKRQYDEMVAYWTAERMYNHLYWESIEKFGVKFENNKDENLHGLKALCFFLSNDDRFETELGYSFKKGIYLRGKYGVGKTHMVKCLSTNGLKPIYMSSMIAIKDKVANDGYFNLGVSRLIYIDDVGTEDLPIMHYGNKINWFKDFIEKVYYEGKNFNNLIFSTNCNIKELTEKYGERVADRIAEMFNIVDVRGKSKRIENLKKRKIAIDNAEKAES